MENRKSNRPGSPSGSQSQNPMQPTRAGTDEGMTREEQEEEETGGRHEEEEEATTIRQDRGSPSGGQPGSPSSSRGSPGNQVDRGRGA